MNGVLGGNDRIIGGANGAINYLDGESDSYAYDRLISGANARDFMRGDAWGP